MYNWVQKNDGWVLLVVLIVLVLSVSAITIHIIGFKPFWLLWNIPIRKLAFFDMLNLTSGYDSIVAGFDPLYSNPYDPGERPMNHPRLLQCIMSWIGWGRSYTLVLGFIGIGVFFCGILLAFTGIDKKTAVIVALATFSPPVILGLERGNHDLYIFFLVSIAVSFSRHVWISVPVLLFSAFIKLFPIFGVVYLLRFDKGKFFLWCSITIAIFIIYLIYNRTDLQQVISSTGAGYLYSYGVQVINTRIALGYRQEGEIFSYIPIVTLLISMVIFFFGSYAHKSRPEFDRSHIDSFRLSAGIYVCTFMLGNMWDYRLMFLLFSIPQLMCWVSLKQFRLVALTALVSLLVSCWITYFDTNEILPYFIDELANYVLFATFLYLLLSSMPEWVHDLYCKFNRQDG